MKHEDFKDWIEKNCMYETFYEDSEGRIIMIVTEMDAWMMCNKFAETKETLETNEYERGFVDGMQKQMQSSVDKAVNAMTRPTYYIPSKDQREWVGLTDEEIENIYMETMNFQQNARALEAKLKELNT